MEVFSWTGLMGLKYFQERFVVLQTFAWGSALEIVLNRHKKSATNFNDAVWVLCCYMRKAMCELAINPWMWQWFIISALKVWFDYSDDLKEYNSLKESKLQHENAIVVNPIMVDNLVSRFNGTTVSRVSN